MHYLPKAKGFTLIELLVVVAIIGVLISIVITGLTASKTKSRDARRIADIKTIQLALETYYNDNAKFPNCIYNSDGGANCPGSSPAFEGTYLTKTPQDPSNVNYHYVAEHPGGNGSPCTFYQLGAPLEVPTNSLGGDVAFVANGTNEGNCTTNASSYTYFNGNAASCAGASAASPDACYDVTP